MNYYVDSWRKTEVTTEDRAGWKQVVCGLSSTAVVGVVVVAVAVAVVVAVAVAAVVVAVAAAAAVV